MFSCAYVREKKIVITILLLFIKIGIRIVKKKLDVKERKDGKWKSMW